MAAASKPNTDCNSLIEYLRQVRNFNVADAERTTFENICKARLAEINVDSANSYVDYLQVHPEEFKVLFDRVIGSRDRFFRDQAAWQYLSDEFLPRLANRETGPLRFWSVSCGKGHEAYSLAVLLCEQFGEEAFRERIKIFATDTSEASLQVARQAVYAADDLAEISEERLRKYFVPSNSAKFMFRPELRRSLIFGCHSVLDDPAISRMDLILCRHVLIYENLQTQSKILLRMRFALRENGCLLLGSGEDISPQPLFVEISARPKIFGRSNDRSVDKLIDNEIAPEVDENTYDRVKEAAFESSPVAQMSVDCDGRLATANARARVLFGLNSQDIGKPFQDLEVSYRPLELRSLIDQVCTEEKPLVQSHLQRHSGPGRTQLFDVHLRPIFDEGTSTRIGVTIQFNDLTELYDLQDKLVTVNHQLQTANEELQSAHEELETTNEELQSTNEELETTNEELQSTNEELETMNEELQSTNIELETANNEQRSLADTLAETNLFLQSILISMKCGVIVLDGNYKIVEWNDYCRELWGLRADEVNGHNLFDLDIGLPVSQMKAPLRTFVQLKKDYEELVLDAINRRGRKIRCTIRATSLENANQPGVVLLIDERSTEDGTADQQAEQ